jgi:hypothetical protein
VGELNQREGKRGNRGAVLGIRIRRIRMFLGLPETDPLVRGTDPDPDPDQNVTDPQHCRGDYSHQSWVENTNMTECTQEISGL